MVGVALEQHLAGVDECPVLAGQADRPAAVLVDQADDLLVKLAQNHFHDVHDLFVGDAHALAKLARDAHRLQEVADLRSAPVHDDRVHADQLQHDDIASEACLERGLGHRVAAILDDDRLVVEALNVGQCLGQNLGFERSGGGLEGHGRSRRVGLRLGLRRFYPIVRKQSNRATLSTSKP